MFMLCCAQMMLEEELDKDNAYRQATDRPIEDDNRTAVGQVRGGGVIPSGLRLPLFFCGFGSSTVHILLTLRIRIQLPKLRISTLTVNRQVGNFVTFFA
jgi:hypothetical protein